MLPSKINIIISGGGTGGHIFPAIAIANAIRKKCSTADILFVGAKGRMEMEKVPAAGYPIVGLWISGLQRRITVKNLLFPVKVIASMCKARRIIKDFHPHVVIGVGGYASGPMLKAASQKHIPTLIQEQNSFPGITNKILAKHVNKICVAYEGMQQYFPSSKIVLTGNPIRQDISMLEAKKQDAISFFGLNPSKKTVLVVGGSLGARSVNQAIANNIKSFADNDVQLIWQTGKMFYAEAVSYVKSLSFDGVKVYDFIKKMDYAYAAADVVVSRAGAIAISELMVVGKPAILIPSPNVAEDHQTKNAMSLVEKNAALIIKNAEANEKLWEILNKILCDTDQQQRLIKNISALAKKNAADDIADIVLELVKI